MLLEHGERSLIKDDRWTLYRVFFQDFISFSSWLCLYCVILSRNRRYNDCEQKSDQKSTWTQRSKIEAPEVEKLQGRFRQAKCQLISKYFFYFFVIVSYLFQKPTKRISVLKYFKSFLGRPRSFLGFSLGFLINNISH